MSIIELGEIKASLYKISADLGVVFQRCEEARALKIGVSVEVARRSINEVLDDLRPDPPDYLLSTNDQNSLKKVS